jgi:hypothetical protein
LFAGLKAEWRRYVEKVRAKGGGGGGAAGSE